MLPTHAAYHALLSAHAHRVLIGALEPDVAPGLRPQLVADGPQRPRWFVSHWWGEAVRDFIACLLQHAEDRFQENHLDVPYWVCAYANNQHMLADVIRVDPRESSFFKAMKLGEVLTLGLGLISAATSRVFVSYHAAQHTPCTTLCSVYMCVVC